MHTEAVPETVDIGTLATARAGDTLGYARVSTADQSLAAQRNRLLEAGAIRLFTDVASGKRSDRPGLAELIEHARPGDRLCVTRLDRLGRTLRELLETVDGLKARGIHLVSLEERLDTSSAAGSSYSTSLVRLRTSRDGSSPSAPATASRRRENAVDILGARRSTPRRFQRRGNSSKSDCHPLERQNSSVLAGQRLTDSPRRCAKRLLRP